MLQRKQVRIEPVLFTLERYWVDEGFNVYRYPDQKNVLVNRHTLEPGLPAAAIMVNDQKKRPNMVRWVPTLYGARLYCHRDGRMVPEKYLELRHTQAELRSLHPLAVEDDSCKAVLTISGDLGLHPPGMPNWKFYNFKNAINREG